MPNPTALTKIDDKPFYELFFDRMTGAMVRTHHGFASAGKNFTENEGAGTMAQMLAATQLLAYPGLRFYCTDIGQYFVLGYAQDGVTPAWRPMNGRACLGSKVGSLAAPLQTLTGAASGTFTQKFTVPAGLLFPGCTLAFRGLFRKNGTTATGNITVNFGTAGTSADGQLAQEAVAITAGQDVRIDTLAHVVSASVLTRQGITPINVAGSSTATDTGANFATGSAMTLSMGFNTGNAADSYLLVSAALFMEAP